MFPVFLILLVVGGLVYIAWRMLTQSSVDPMSFKFSSSNAKMFAFSGIVLLVALVVISTTIVLNSIRDKVRQEYEVSLQTVVRASHEAMAIWMKTNIESLESMAAIPEVLTVTKSLLEVDPTPDVLIGHPD